MTRRPSFAELSDADLIELLYESEDALPPGALEEFLRRGGTISDRLARILEDERLWQDEGPRGWAVIHAAFLLASLKPPAAFHRLLDALERADRYGLGDLMEEMPAMLASFGPGAAPELVARAETAEIGIDAVFVLLDTLCLVGRRHPEARDLVAGCLRRLVHAEEEDAEIREFAAARLLHFAVEEDRPKLLELVGSEYSKADVENALRGEDLGDPVPAGNWLDFYLPDEVEDRHREWEEAEAEFDEEGEPYADDEEHGPPPPPLRKETGPGRNDPCPCGSGKKYKKCCGK